jgi:hypothetical protein
MKEIEIKGHAFRTYLEVVGDIWGVTAKKQLLLGLASDFRETLQRGLLLSSGWYPVAWYRQLYDVLLSQLPNEKDLPSRIGEATVRKDIAGMYSFILKLTSPTLIARHLDRIIGSYVRGGEASMVVTDNIAVGELSGWHGMNHPLWEEFCSGGKLVLETSGAKRVAAEFKLIAPGHARFYYQWGE